MPIVARGAKMGPVQGEQPVVHLRRSGTYETYCSLPLGSVPFIEATLFVVEHGAGAGTGVTCDRCADSYRSGPSLPSSAPDGVPPSER
jgi:hypothetical protein